MSDTRALILGLCYVYINYAYIILYSWLVFRSFSIAQHAARWSTVSVWSDRLVRSSIGCASRDSTSGSVRLERIEPEESSLGRRIGRPVGPGVVPLSSIMRRHVLWQLTT